MVPVFIKPFKGFEDLTDLLFLNTYSGILYAEVKKSTLLIARDLGIFKTDSNSSCISILDGVGDKVRDCLLDPYLISLR